MYTLLPSRFDTVITNPQVRSVAHVHMFNIWWIYRYGQRECCNSRCSTSFTVHKFCLQFFFLCTCAKIQPASPPLTCAPTASFVRKQQKQKKGESHMCIIALLGSFWKLYNALCSMHLASLVTKLHVYLLINKS